MSSFNNNFPAYIQAVARGVHSALETIGSDVVASASAAAPIDTGALSKSINFTLQADGAIAQAIVSTHLPASNDYAAYQEGFDAPTHKTIAGAATNHPNYMANALQLHQTRLAALIASRIP